MSIAIVKYSMLDKITMTIGELPASPAIVSAVMGLTANLNASVEDVGEVLAADATLAAKVLKLSNSSFYGRSRSVSSIKEAILILGFYTLRSMVIASSTHSIYYRKDNAQFSEKLWNHSLASGMACRIVARRIQHSRIEEIFMAGLLHDIGKVVLGQKLTVVYDSIVKEVERSGRGFQAIELEKLGFDHAVVGATILKKWNFPKELVEGVEYHHDTPDDTHSEVSIGSVVAFSNLLAKQIAGGFAEPAVDCLSRHPVAERFRLDSDCLRTMTEDLQSRFEEEKHLFEDN
jgi:putative nucleotidyltransferase with HDIG domain